MARGTSGRIVIEVDPTEKQRLYEALEKDGLTLKNWFLDQARTYLRERNQLQLRLVAEEKTNYNAKPFQSHHDSSDSTD